MDWNELGNELAAATDHAVEALLKEAEPERLYSLCLVTADDGMSVGLNGNTEEYCARREAEESDYEEITRAYRSYLRWSPSEWRFEGAGDKFFDRINRKLSRYVLDGRSSEASFDALVAAMIEALSRQKQKARLADVTAFVTVTDSDRAKGIESASVKRLNSSDVADEFLSHFE